MDWLGSHSRGTSKPGALSVSIPQSDREDALKCRSRKLSRRMEGRRRGGKGGGIGGGRERSSPLLNEGRVEGDGEKV